jgi:RND family efflux transporter MFP subunit
MSAKAKLIKIIVPILIIALGIIAASLLIAGRAEPKKVARENPGALVETVAVSRGARQVEVHGTGIVQARRQVEIAPQVGGRVVEMSPNLVTGGFFRQGELLFRIEAADYRLAIDKAKAAVAKAEYELTAMAGQSRVAREEWTRLNIDDGKTEANPLVLYEPQMKNAQAFLLSAQAAVRQAELDLERTQVRAPFAAVVRSESVDTGQLVRVGTPAAVLAGTEQAEIVVPLPLEELGWLRIPRPGAQQAGSPATIQLTTGGRTFEWPGRIVRSLGEVDPQGRMARVVVAVEDPYGLKARAADRPELAVGTFLQVILHGEVLPDVAVLPASALRDGEQVWIMNDSHLKIRPVQVVRRAREEVVIGSGLQNGDQVVLTNVAGAAEGMKLRPVAGKANAEAAAAAPAKEKI